MKETDIGAELAQLRKNAKISQADVAAAMKVDQSSVSRLEQDPKASLEDAHKYLAALNGDPEAKRFAEYLMAKWVELPKPHFRHPYMGELQMAETTLVKLKAFIENPATPPALAQQGKLYQEGLRQATAYLLDLKHSVCFVGPIMAGKTTGLCFVADLLIDEGKTLKQRVPFDTGAGWTTLCEVQINTLDSGLEKACKFGIVVHPYPQDEVYRLVIDLCTSWFAMRDNKETESRVVEEIEKVLRSMAEFPRRTKGSDDDDLEDPLEELAKLQDNPMKLAAEFKARMKLDERTTTDIWFDAPSFQDGLKWLQTEFRKINNGRNTKVSLPKRIDVFVPKALMNDSTYEWKFVDMKGAEETAIRPDIQSYLDDQRAITVLCSRFTGAQTMLEVLGHLTATGKTATISDRLVFVVFPRKEEVAAMNSEDGSPIETPAQAYALRKAQIRSKLAKFPAAKDLAIQFLDVEQDSPKPLRELLLRKFKTLRDNQTARVKEIISATGDLITKFQQDQAQKALAKLAAKLQQFLDQYLQLPPKTMDAHTRLIDALNYRHHRTVWASTRRNGEWDNLDSYQIVGVAANMDAEARSAPAVAAVESILDELSKDPECQAIKSHLDVLKTNVAAWKLEFLEEVARRSQEIFRAGLFEEDVLWNACEAYWGEGKGFRAKVAAKVKEWLQAKDHDWIQEAIEGIIRKDWEDFFIAKIKTQCNGTGNGASGTSDEPAASA